MCRLRGEDKKSYRHLERDGYVLREVGLTLV